MKSPGQHNRLALATSPYLQQHAQNPVDWYPWGEEAFAAARATGKPVLLSIGYAACHWCHVMAHESFDDPATAVVMNDLFINIKVDREERPDVDRIYQLAHQLLTRRGGGWPLTMFLAHDDQRPFFGGTYFPPAPRHGMPGFTELLQRVARFYRERQPELREQSDALVDALRRIDAPAGAETGPLDGEPLKLLRAQLEQRFDREYGGFTPAPKFPHPGMPLHLLRHWHASAGSASPDLMALFMSTLTAKRMADGGLYDQVGGGFCRYSVDERWEIPHFEKMLYDNGALLSLYAAAAGATGDEQFARVAAQTGEFLLRDFTAPEGAFISSWDADSGGHEGQFYVWEPAQLRAALGESGAAAVGRRFGMDGPANFEGRWHLRVVNDLPFAEADRLRLLAARASRAHPGRDDKILTGWNGLAIRGLADAARTLGRADFADAAQRALAFLRERHWRDGRLLATSRGGDARLPAYLDDHALLLDAILALSTVRFDAGALDFAAQLADALLDRFEDAAHGGFFFTAHDHETLIHRTRSFQDDATASGNAVAAGALQRLGWLLGEPRYLLAAERALRAAWPTLADAPLGQVHMAAVLEEHLCPHEFIVLRGEQALLETWRREVQRVWRPRVSVIAVPADATGLPVALADKTPRGAIVAYHCRGSRCEAPEFDLPALLQRLDDAV